MPENNSGAALAGPWPGEGPRAPKLFLGLENNSGAALAGPWAGEGAPKVSYFETVEIIPPGWRPSWRRGRRASDRAIDRPPSPPHTHPLEPSYGELQKQLHRSSVMPLKRVGVEIQPLRVAYGSFWLEASSGRCFATAVARACQVGCVAGPSKLGGPARIKEFQTSCWKRRVVQTAFFWRAPRMRGAPQKQTIKRTHNAVWTTRRFQQDVWNSPNVSIE